MLRPLSSLATAQTGVSLPHLNQGFARIIRQAMVCFRTFN
jgi:hypothetical protein